MPGSFAFSTFSAVSRAIALAIATSQPISGIYNPVHNCKANYGDAWRTSKEKNSLSYYDFARIFWLIANDRELGSWWSQGESNPRPLECHSSALPTELWPRPRCAVLGLPRRHLTIDRHPETYTAAGL